MRVVVPYANDLSDPEIHYCVRLNFDLLGIEPEWVKMTEPNSYALLINELWHEGPFVIVEHDVIVWRGAIESVWECDKPLCGYDGTLCCTKINPFGFCPVDSRTGWNFIDKTIFDFYHRHQIPFHDHGSKAPIVNLNRQNIPPKV